MPISDDVWRFAGDLVALRRELHQHPELSWREERTGERVAEVLAAAGIPVQRLARTGAVATLRGDGPRTVLLRADLDALPIEEDSRAPYASRVPGVMHACGHDGHVAMALVAARVLSGRRLPGTVRIAFQPAEEGEAGARTMVEEGVMEGVDVALGVHLWNELPVGTLGVKAGPLMAATDALRIVVRGRGGHGAKPHRSADPVVAAAHVITALQTIVSREVSPVDAAVVTVASVHGGQAHNVIPDEVELLGTIRTFDQALRRSVAEAASRIAGGIAEGLGCRATVEVREGNRAVINDPAATEIARRAALRVVDAPQVVAPEPTMGGEDMSVYFEKAPGCFVFVGSANPGRGLDQPHHSPRFDFDEDALLVGCDFLVNAAEEALR